MLGGLGFALAYGPLNIAATNGIAPRRAGPGRRAPVNTSFQFGGALVLAVVTAVNSAFTGGSGSPDDLLEGFVPAVVVSLVAAAVGFLAVTLRRPERVPQPDPA